MQPTILIISLILLGLSAGLLIVAFADWWNGRNE